MRWGLGFIFIGLFYFIYLFILFHGGWGWGVGGLEQSPFLYAIYLNFVYLQAPTKTLFDAVTVTVTCQWLVLIYIYNLFEPAAHCCC